jgi:hypothetical protein
MMQKNHTAQHSDSTRSPGISFAVLLPLQQAVTTRFVERDLRACIDRTKLD